MGDDAEIFEILKRGQDDAAMKQKQLLSLGRTQEGEPARTLDNAENTGVFADGDAAFDPHATERIEGGSGDASVVLTDEGLVSDKSNEARSSRSGSRAVPQIDVELSDSTGANSKSATDSTPSSTSGWAAGRQREKSTEVATCWANVRVMQTGSGAGFERRWVVLRSNNVVQIRASDVEGSTVQHRLQLSPTVRVDESGPDEVSLVPASGALLRGNSGFQLSMDFDVMPDEWMEFVEQLRAACASQ